MNTREFSSKQESRVAKLLNGKKVANSGATKFNKGDVRTDRFLIECKTATSEKSSFSIKKEWLKKNKEEAFESGLRYSALAIDFGGDEDYFVIDSKLMKELVELLDNQEFRG